MSKEPVAVVGIGQTKHVAARHDVSSPDSSVRRPDAPWTTPS